MSIRVTDNGRPRIRKININPRLPKGVTMTAQRVKERIIKRPENGAAVHPVNGGEFVSIDKLSREEAHQLMQMFLDDEGLAYIGFDIGRVLYPASVEKVG